MSDDEVELEQVTKPRRGRPTLNRPAEAPVSSPEPIPPLAPDPIDADAEEGFALYASVPAAKMRVMELKRNYRPIGEYEVVGYWQEEIKKKGPDGKEFIARPKAFIPNERAPSPMPGVDNPNKLWAGTVIRINVDEAKRMRSLDIADVSLEDD